MSELIDRRKLLRQLSKEEYFKMGDIGMMRAVKKIKEQPKISDGVHGHWVGIEYDGYADGFPVYDTWECSKCGNEIHTEDTPPYCEMCGAKMD